MKNKLLEAFPWEYGCIICIFMTKAMYLTAPVVIIVWLRLNERVESINNLAITNNDDSYRANAAALIISRFKINCCKIFHFIPQVPSYLSEEAVYVSHTIFIVETIFFNISLFDSSIRNLS